MSGRAALVISLWLVTQPLAAESAAELERAKASFKAGAAAYGAGDYTAAIEALELAYELTPLPAIAFSLAQAERRQYFVSHERVYLERAIALFRRYVEQVPGTGRRSDALDALNQLEPLFAQGATTAAVGEARAEVRGTRIMVSTVPAAARVALDGGEWEPSPVIREVQPGKHSIRVEADGYLTSERETTAVAGELILSEVELHERPSELLLRTPQGAEVYVDGHFVRRGGARVALALRSGRHALRVARAGRRPYGQTLLLTPGEQLNVEVRLEPTLQRKAARGLFIVSGALLATSSALVGVMLARQQRAEDFLSRRERANVSSVDLARYRDDARTRDGLRTPAILIGTLAVGSMLAALLLHLLDTVDPHESFAAASAADEVAPPSARARLQASLGLLPGGAGLHLEL